jgi:putative sterol carrier protein
MKKELGPIKGMMQGKLRVRGDLPTIVRYSKATQEMADCTTRFEIDFPDD